MTFYPERWTGHFSDTTVPGLSLVSVPFLPCRAHPASINGDTSSWIPEPDPTQCPAASQWHMGCKSLWPPHSSKVRTTLGNQAKKFTQRSPECECQPAYSQSRRIKKAESKLPRSGFVAKGHPSTAILGASSLTCGGGTDFIHSCGSEGWEGDVPGNFWQPCRKRMLTVCFTLNLA